MVRVGQTTRACGWGTSRARARSLWVAFASDVPTLWNCSAAKPPSGAAPLGTPRRARACARPRRSRRAPLVYHQRDTLARKAGPVEQPRDAPEAGWQLIAVGDVARVDVVAQAQTMLAVEGVTEADLAQVVVLLLSVAALGQLGALEFVLAGRAQRVAHVDGVEMVPEGLGGELAGGEAPQVGEDAVAVPVGDFGFGSGGTDAVEGGEQEEMGDGGALGGGHRTRTSRAVADSTRAGAARVPQAFPKRRGGAEPLATVRSGSPCGTCRGERAEANAGPILGLDVFRPSAGCNTMYGTR